MKTTYPMEHNAMSCRYCGRTYESSDDMTAKEIESECVDDCPRYDSDNQA